MKKIITLLVISFSGTILAQSPALAPSIPATDVYHGIEVVDEYRNLENLEAPAVIDWMKNQTIYTEATLKSISKRNEFLNRMLNIDKKTEFFYGAINTTTDGTNFYTKMRNDENYRKLYCKKGINGKEQLLFDPKDFKPEDNKKYLISYYKPTKDGSKVVIAVTEGGKEIAEVVIFDVLKNKMLPEIIANTWPSGIGGISWLPDNSGIVYVHIPNIDMKSDDFIMNTKAVVYKLGSNPNTIKDIFSISNNPELKLDKADLPIVTIPQKFNNYIFGRVGGATNYSDYFYANAVDVYNDKVIWKPFFKKEEKIKSFIIDGNDVIFISENNNKSQLCKTSLDSPNFSTPEVIVQQIKDEIIDDVVKTKDGFFFTTVKNGVVANFYFYNGRNYKKIIMPTPSGKIYMQTISEDVSDIWISCSGWTQNRKRYKCDIKTDTLRPEDFREQPDYPEYKDIVVEEIEIITHDGLALPLTIIHKKGLDKNGKNRVIMDGYGAYGDSNEAYFNPYSLLWVLDGGILVHTHVRGGGEKGDAWHKGGFKKTKPNTWKDFISSAKFLIKEKYTSPEYLGVEGVSAGGILIARAITERPDLFKAAIIDVGSINAVRAEIAPNGPNNIKEFGTVKNEEEFKALLEMDAFHHIKKGTKYPATLITAGMNDPRVIAWIPAKFAAKLQANNSGDNPIFLNVGMESGHGGDVSFDKLNDRLADSYAFFYWQLGHPDYKLKKE
ncbi:prolyl oligopeptidase family serine peptidase [Flavobacterium sp. PS2]|uniref:prolyl oligopeptidase family serine peptidase n=1 Tax=Flavobacterium sp. PS2 TaxID=3384157 RepID=UPI00390CC88E